MMTQTDMLRPVQPHNLTTYANANDLRRDLHTFVGYVSRRTIKRSFRGNELPPADYKRLEAIIADDRPPGGDHDDGAMYSAYNAEAYSWIDYLDRLALDMGFVSYDTKGAYRGYSSQEPSFADNVIRFNADAYRAFLALSPAKQEHELREVLVTRYGSSTNEFYQRSIRGRLDRFPNFGSATGVMRTLNFATPRRLLLDLLRDCAPGTWYGTADLVAYLKAHQPYFLIPLPVEPPKPKKPPKNPTWLHALPPQVEKRYGNFYEGGDLYSFGRDAVPDDAPDGFERVEGRFVERFLEGIPLTLGYVEVAYADRAESSDKPSRGLLRAFRVNERFHLAMSADIPPPKVTVQPNFEIYVESPFYPAHLVNRLAPLCDVIREDTTTVLKLEKRKVAAQVAENAGLDVAELLARLSGRELPQNVAVELGEWAGHAGVFTLYDGFSLVESADERPADTFTAERISPTMQLVRHPGALYTHLMGSGAVVMRVGHADAALTSLPEGAHTVFARRQHTVEAPAQQPKEAVVVQRQALIALSFPGEAAFETFRAALLEARCIPDINREKLTLTIAARDEALVKQVARRLGETYAIRFEDLA